MTCPQASYKIKDNGRVHQNLPEPEKKPSLAERMSSSWLCRTTFLVRCFLLGCHYSSCNCYCCCCICGVKCCEEEQETSNGVDGAARDKADSENKQGSPVTMQPASGWRWIPLVDPINPQALEKQ